MNVFSGKVGLITGGGSGIGRAVCRLVAARGGTVVAVDRHLEAAQATVDLLGGGDHLALSCDVSSSASVAALFASPRLPTPCLLANAAGVTQDAFLKKMTEQQFEDVVSVNLKGTFLVMQAFYRRLLAEGAGEGLSGSVVNVSSIVARGGNMGQTNYAASKAGVEALTKSAAKEMAKDGVRVNCVVPGFIHTPMVDTVPEHLRDFLVDNVIPMRRMGNPEEVAEAVAFLLSDAASYVTATTLDVTGGLTGTM